MPVYVNQAFAILRKQCPHKLFLPLNKSMTTVDESMATVGRSMTTIGGSMTTIGGLTKVAVCQTNVTTDKQANFNQCKQLIEKAKGLGATVVFLPESFDYIAETHSQLQQLKEPITGSLMSSYKDLARDTGLWLSLGGFHEDTGGDKIQVTHVIINADGEVVGQYSKSHLFHVDIPGKIRLSERDKVEAGTKVTSPVPTPAGNVGLGICYDMRFPEFSILLRQHGSHILTFPSAFTRPTGQAHWEVLLRSRAIENQCYVIAAAQTGVHNSKRASYGHSMIIDPWGKILAEIAEEIDVKVAEVDLNYLQKVRTEMPVQDHKRTDLYTVASNPSISAQALKHQDREFYDFAEHRIHPDFVFYLSEHSYAFVNRKPVLPGHVLISPLTVTKRLKDLSVAQNADLFQVVQLVAEAIEKQYRSSSVSISIQDGPAAGQTVEAGCGDPAIRLTGVCKAATFFPDLLSGGQRHSMYTFIFYLGQKVILNRMMTSTPSLKSEKSLKKQVKKRVNQASEATKI